MRAVAISLMVLITATEALFAQSNGKLSRTEVIVIADLSDRIDPHLHRGQLDRDTAIVHVIADEFGNIVRRNRFLFSRDRLRMIYIGGEGTPVEPRVDVARMNETHHIVVRELPGSLADFRSTALRPYLVARTSYVGADLWSWFHNTAPKVLPVDDPNRDIHTRIIILTDGYLEFAPTINREPGTSMHMSPLRGRKDWKTLYQKYRLTPAGGKLESTDVLVLEMAPVRPTDNTTEQEILERYWSDWFTAMGAKSSFLTNSEALPSIRDAIRQFLAH